MRQIRFWLLTLTTTCLIWIAADQGVTRSLEITVPLSIKPAVGSVMSLTVVDPDVRLVTLEFKGPNRTINQLRSLQDSLDADIEISDRSPGRYQVNLVDELRRHLEQFPDGLALVSSFPASVAIDVDRFVSRQIPLLPGLSTYRFELDPRLEPATVTVEVPEGRFGQLTTEEQVITIPIVGAFDGKPEGQLIERTVSVPRQLDGGLALRRVQPERVVVTAELEERTKEGRIPTVPIGIFFTTKEVADRYEVLYARQEKVVTRPVAIRGPTDVVDDLLEDASRYNVWGYIRISREDVPHRGENGPIPKVPLIANLPPGVELTEDPEPVDIILQPRE